MLDHKIDVGLRKHLHFRETVKLLTFESKYQFDSTSHKLSIFQNIHFYDESLMMWVINLSYLMSVDNTYSITETHRAETARQF